jgi:hypothetical protein
MEMNRIVRVGTFPTIDQHERRQPSFTDLLPWVEYDPESQSFLLEDGVSLGAVFEIEPVGCEARTSEFMTHLRDAIQTVINEAIPELDEGPWILQVYVQDEPSLAGFARSLAGYAHPGVRESGSPGLLGTTRPSWRLIWRIFPAKAACYSETVRRVSDCWLMTPASETFPKDLQRRTGVIYA